MTSMVLRAKYKSDVMLAKIFVCIAFQPFLYYYWIFTKKFSFRNTNEKCMDFVTEISNLFILEIQLQSNARSGSHP